MEHARMASRLLRELSREMNGAMVAGVADRGLHYAKNYGVSTPSVRRTAKELAPNHDFAKYLWQQPVRELKIAAITIADPLKITIEELDFWLDGAVNGELSENLASFLLARTSHVHNIIERYSCSQDPNKAYIALLTATKGYQPAMSVDYVIDIIAKVEVWTIATERSAALLLLRAGNESEENHKQILNYIEKLKASDDEIQNRIAAEIVV